MAESMKDYEAELEASFFKKIEEGDILTGTVVSVDDKEIIVDLKYYAEGIIQLKITAESQALTLKKKYIQEMRFLQLLLRQMMEMETFFSQGRSNGHSCMG